MTIRIRPEEIMGFFKKHADRLAHERYIVAEDGSSTIALSASGGIPHLEMLNNGFAIANCTTDDEERLENNATMLFDLAFGKEWSEIGLDDPADDGDGGAISDQDAFYERDDQLHMAFYDFLVTVVEDESLIYDKDYELQFESIFNDVLQAVSDIGLPVRRPIIVDEDDGTYTVIEYPYEDGAL